MLTNQKVTARLSAVDQAGNPVVLVGPFTWAASPANVVSIAPAADTLSAEITPITAGAITVSAVGQGTSGSAPLTIDPVVLTMTIAFDVPVPL